MEIKNNTSMKDVTETKKLNTKEKIVKFLSKQNLKKLFKKTKSLFTKQSLKKATKKVKQELGFILNKKSEKEELNIARKPIILGIWAIFGLLFFFVIWGCLSKIDSAAIASGVVVVDKNKKTIQHLEGGIIEKIFVKDGDTVEAGQLLIKLDETAAKAQLDMLKKQMFSLQALNVRLKRERDDASGLDEEEAIVPESEDLKNEKITLENTNQKIIPIILKDEVSEVDEGNKEVANININEETLSENAKISNEIKTKILSENNSDLELTKANNELFFNSSEFTTDNPELTKILEGEQKLYETRKQAIDGQIDVLNQKIEQSKEQIVGLKAQKKSMKQRISFVTDELNSVRQLYKQRIVSKTEYLNLKKQLAELNGDLGEYVASIAQVQQAIGETKIEIINTKINWLNSVVEQLQESQNKIVDLQERLTASSDVFIRTSIIAPQSGIISDLKFYTKGGVVPPSAPVMDIVPQDDELVIEARVNPQDIDVVHAGLKARVMLSAYKQKNVPLINGEVILVSADSFQDQMTGQSFYKTRVKINQEELAKLKHVKLYPGMPAETYIITGSRTFFQYLMSPVTDSMRRAFREE